MQLIKPYNTDLNNKTMELSISQKFFSNHVNK